MGHILKIENLDFAYGQKEVFKSLSLAVDTSSFVIFAGNNQSGKTTLLKLICGLLPSEKKVVAEYIYVNSKRFQDTAIFFGISLENMEHHFLFSEVYKELAFSLENLNYNKDKIEDRIREVVTLFGNKKILDQKIDDLTLSEKQELLIMLALLHEPKVLLLDEPFKMMSSITRRKVIGILKKLQKDSGITVIITTTNLELVLETEADRLYILYDGKIVMEGNPINVLQEEKILNKVGLELPFMIDLSLKLKFYEVLKTTETTLEGMVNTLWKSS